MIILVCCFHSMNDNRSHFLHKVWCIVLHSCSLYFFVIVVMNDWFSSLKRKVFPGNRSFSAKCRAIQLTAPVQSLSQLYATLSFRNDFIFLVFLFIVKSAETSKHVYWWLISSVPSLFLLISWKFHAWNFYYLRFFKCLISDIIFLLCMSHPKIVLQIRFH